MSPTPLPVQLRLVAVCLAAAALALACGGDGERRAPASAASPPAPRPSILLVTLDTTRADAIGPEATGIVTAAFNALAARGQRFRQAYATVPETLPSHASMLTGLYPAGHGVHENGRSLDAAHPLVAERLRHEGFRTAAFVSSFTLARRFGLARGFETYDDNLPATGLAERGARETTDAAIAYLERTGLEPLFLWVHYFDPHHPYEPPEPYRQQFKGRPYLGEVAAMDGQLGRLLAAFDQRAPGPRAIVVAGDHGEGLGDHGETQHGNLLYQSTMHVPLVIVGPGVPAGVSDAPVSTRRIFHTILDWAGLGAEASLRKGDAEVVLGEAMKPFLEYGWQPQVMTVDGRHKSILAGRLEIYDLVADPGEARDLSGDPALRSSVPATLRDYPVPSAETAAAPPPLDEDARRALASLGYIGATAAPVIRKDAPRPVDMVPLFDTIEEASGLFVAEDYGAAIPLLERILEKDPHNLDAALRLATSHSALGRDARALELFRRAAQISPSSPDVRTYLALHYARGKDWERAIPMLERVVAESPGRLPALEALTRLRERQGRLDEAVTLRQKIYALRTPTPVELIQLGELAMGAGRTDAAIAAFESARRLAPPPFRHDLELGLLYVDARRLAEAREALDRVPPSHQEYPMALFKRAQVSVLLNEPDRAARIAAARRHADATTRPLIARERLFQ
ncbi:MAG TPA: sulfatase-like hydrolase/transferase [Vicinamibacterales bacterium]|nr:sulfatase-like hydrolase/transferase [Vicinamibacterales bacterium]